jgi:hypothetical protein
VTERGIALRVETNVLPKIQSLCESLCLEENEILKKARLLISVYHEIVWGALKNVGGGVAGVNIKKHTEAVTYLSVFPSAIDKKELQTNLLAIFQADWYVELFEDALGFVSLYKHNSKVYTRMLTECYFSERECSDKELQCEMDIERSSYFKRKKEAVLLFGVALWGISIPQKLSLPFAVDHQAAFFFFFYGNGVSS